MNQTIPHRLCLFVCSIMLLFSCMDDHSLTGPGGDIEPEVNEYATVIIRSVDEYGEPVSDVCIDVRVAYPWPSNDTESDSTFEITVLPDKDGLIVLKDLLPGFCMIENQTKGYKGDETYFCQTADGMLASDDTLDVTFCFPKDPISLIIDIKGLVNDDQYVPLANIDVYFRDGSRYILNKTPLITDEHGQVRFEEFDSALLREKYWLIFERDGFTCSGQSISDVQYENGEWFLYVVTDNIFLSPDILSPDDNAEYASSMVRFVGECYDFEDGWLPDEGLTWISSIDGIIGTGRDITAELSPGQHMITLKGTDSSARLYTNNNDQTSINVTVFHYVADSYFPMPKYGYWDYQLEPVSFALMNKWGEAEYWTLDEMTVTSNDYDTRSCLMAWTVERDGVSVVSRYFCEDHLRFEAGAVYVTSTSEQLTVYDGPDFSAIPVEDLSITTTYSPEYPYLRDYHDPSCADYTESTISVESSIVSTLIDAGSHIHEEYGTIHITYDPGSPVTLATPSGTYNTIPVTTHMGSVERTMYLAPGVGVVQLDTDIAGTPVTASLVETNMETYAGAPRFAFMDSEVSGPVVIAGELNENRFVQLREIMRGICPF